MNKCETFIHPSLQTIIGYELNIMLFFALESLN